MKNRKKSHLSFLDPLRVKLHDTVGNRITYKVNSFLVFQNNDCGHDQKKSILAYWRHERYFKVYSNFRG